MSLRHFTAVASIVLLLAQLCCAQDAAPSAVSSTLKLPASGEGHLRVATFNASLNRNKPGELRNDLEKGSKQIRTVATIIRAVRPDVILINEFDYQDGVDLAGLFADRYLADEKLDVLGGAAWPMPYRFAAAVNTGVLSELDINGNGKTEDPEDAWGFGKFPGQYGMAVLSRFPISTQNVRTFQQLKWSAMPGAQQPKDPQSQAPYYAAKVWPELRISSKSLWDVPIETPQGLLSFIVSHPTPPAFDGPADHNGCRNHDEIRLICDYLDEGVQHEYLVDDRGQRGGLPTNRMFVVAGDLNSDPIDGDSKHEAIDRLIKHARVLPYAAPSSRGAVQAAVDQSGVNKKHRGDASHDTADFFDGQVGNLRVDYVLPSRDFVVSASGVYWPEPVDEVQANKLIKELNAASDHHLVWIDIGKRKVAPPSATR